jgi:hypothetical protein
MKRATDWRQRLQRTFDAFEGVPFTWGKTDCACFASACIEAVSGATDALGTYRDQYDSRLSARARILGRGFRTLKDAAGDRLSALGFARVPPRFAREGDVGVTVDNVLCVRTSKGFEARGLDGNFYTARNVCAAWRIGD